MHPLDPTAETVVGHPVADASYWLCQGEAGSCQPPTVASVLTDVFGVPLHSHAEVKVRALSLELIGFDLHPGRVPGAAGLGPEQGWSGLSAQAVAALCGSYGVKLEVVDACMDDLATRLAAGAAVVVCLDTERLRVGPAEGTLPGLGLDNCHALVLTGLDPAAGLAYLNSPADPTGTGVAIPLAQLAEGWAAAGNALLLAELPGELPGLYGWPPVAAAADPWAGLGETVRIDDLTAPRPAATHSLAWLPFSFVARAAARGA